MFELIQVCNENLLHYCEYEKAFNTDLNQYQSRIYPLKDAEHLRWYHIRADKKYIGAIWLEKSAPDDFAVLGIFIADKNFRDKGIGKRAIEQIIENDLQFINTDKIVLRVREENKRAIACYNSVGFKETLKYKKEKLNIVEMIWEKSVRFTYLNKANLKTVASDIFNILADNMEIIAPTGNKREDDFKCWCEGISKSLQKDKRQIILIMCNLKIIGYFQYYINESTFVMEEIQIKSSYQGRNIFRELYGYIITNINENIKYVEAYANKANVKSIGILEHIGLTKIGMNKNGNSFHFRGKYEDLLKWYESKGDKKC
ncbi:MAG: GNAT family N-acetyltransferase [Clostridia bacterium]|nr:GNAT family N-acetyltransferase [Clostridia bacterium]